MTTPATPQPGPTPETAETITAWMVKRLSENHDNATTCSMLRRKMVEHYTRLERQLAERTRERDEARRERDALSQAFDKLREQVVTGEAANATLRYEVKINVENGLGLHAQIAALRLDRDGLAALCEVRTKALQDADMALHAIAAISQYTKELVAAAYDEAASDTALALTPADALARQRERKQSTET